MTAAQDKGNKFEREVTAYLRDHLGDPVVHRLRNGGTSDRGDVQVSSTWTLELKCYPSDPLRAIRIGLEDLTRERAESGCPFGAVVVKRPGKTDPGEALVVMRLADAVAVMRETI